MIVRGGINLPINIGGVDVPLSSRLNLFRFDAPVQPVDWVTIAEVPAGLQGAELVPLPLARRA
jgi:hypothetical protein